MSRETATDTYTFISFMSYNEFPIRLTRGRLKFRPRSERDHTRRRPVDISYTGRVKKNSFPEERAMYIIRVYEARNSLKEKTTDVRTTVRLSTIQ